jgi:hypothetical protein
MATTKPMPDFIRQKIEERKAAKAAREAEETEEPEAEEAEEAEEPEEEAEEEEGEEEEEAAASPRKNGLSPFRKNGLPSAALSSSPTRRRRRSFDPGRSFDDAAKWVMKNKVPVLVGLGVVGLFWLASKSKKTAALPPRYAYGVRGAFADPTSATWQPNSNPVMTSHATGGDFRTGIQSSSPMYDARYFDYPDYVESYWE